MRAVRFIAGRDVEYVLYAAGALFLAVAIWAVIAGDREGQMTDEEPTLNTRSDE